MKRMFSLLRLLSEKGKLHALYKLREDSFLEKTGWFDSSIQKQSINRAGKPLPWMTYSFISFLESRLCKDMEVFEYGCGNSTLWWAERAHSVTSCEHNHEWYLKLKTNLPENVTLHYSEAEPDDHYSNAIRKSKKEFDIVVIDGERRIECAKNCLHHLKQDGVIIWDNSDRVEYLEGFLFLRENGFKQLEFHGAGPINKYGWSTSIFYRDPNCLAI